MRCGGSEQSLSFRQVGMIWRGFNHFPNLILLCFMKGWLVHSPAICSCGVGSWYRCEGGNGGKTQLLQSYHCFCDESAANICFLEPNILFLCWACNTSVIGSLSVRTSHCWALLSSSVPFSPPLDVQFPMSWWLAGDGVKSDSSYDW